MPQTYDDFLVSRSLEEQTSPHGLPATITTESYEQALDTILLLENIGIQTQITEGGLSVVIDSKETFDRAQKILAEHHLEIAAGNIVAAEYREERSRMRKEN